MVWLLIVLAAGYLCLRMGRWAAPVVRMLADWVHAHPETHDYVGPLLAGGFLVVVFWGHTRSLRRRLWDFLRWISVRMHPAT